MKKPFVPQLEKNYKEMQTILHTITEYADKDD